MDNQIKFSEKEVKQAVYEYLDARKYLYIPIQNQGQWDSKKGVYRRFTGTKGAPDLMVFDHIREKWVCVELKSTIGKQSEDQQEFEHILDVKGGEYFIVRSIDDLNDILGWGRSQWNSQKR